MADIFISYSSYDRSQAMELAKEIRSAGFDVWIDQGGIAAAQNWSSQIVDALNKSKTILFLISSNSVTSHNCAKEIQLANEKHKNILPVVLEDCSLPVIFEYPLAGLQRVPFEHTEAILIALELLASGKTVLESMLNQSNIKDSIIRLAVLPFEDQSPSKDNDWLADGMMDELIATLGSLKSLHISPRNDVISYKQSRTKLDDIAADLKCRYVVDGTVVKMGDQIRIRASLTDAVTHAQVWTEKYTGSFGEIFEFLESTTKQIASALQLHLSPKERKRLEKKPTDNVEAFEMLIRGQDYFRRLTKTDYEHALGLFEAAAELDPSFAGAYICIANVNQALYRNYHRDPELLVQAEKALAHAKDIEGESPIYFTVRSMIAYARREPEQAKKYAERALELDPNYAPGYDALGFAYRALHQQDEVIRAAEEFVRLRENDTAAHFNLLVDLNEMGDLEKLGIAALRAIPKFERHRRLHPDDIYSQVRYAVVLKFASQNNESLVLAKQLLQLDSLDGGALYNIACLYIELGELDEAISTLGKAIQKGFENINVLQSDPGLDAIRGNAEFQVILKDLEQKISTQN